MSYRILHIIDCFLPETMNWLEKTWEECLDVCEHHVHASYYIKPLNTNLHYVSLGIQSHYPISIASKISNWFNHSSNDLLSKYIREHKIQMIHFHFGHVAIRYKNWIRKTGLPFCVSLYGFDYEYLVYKKPAVKLDYLFLAQLGGQFIVEGNYSRHVVQNYGVPNSQIHIVHMLFDRGPINSLSDYRQPIRLLQAATFTEKKNQLGLVHALKDRHASRFVISFIGEKSDKSYYKEFETAIKIKTRHCIRIHDKVSVEKYLETLSNSHFALNLSKRSRSNDTEGGCPVFLKDALSLGKPVISSKHCDIPELVVDGFNGFLLPENDTQAMTDLLDRLLLMSQTEYNLFCSNAGESVKTNIRQKITRQDLMAVYQSML